MFFALIYFLYFYIVFYTNIKNKFLKIKNYYNIFLNKKSLLKTISTTVLNIPFIWRISGILVSFVSG
jgi:hypothetical protein